MYPKALNVMKRSEREAFKFSRT